MSSYSEDAYEVDAYSINAWDLIKISEFVEGAWSATISFKINVTTVIKTRLGIK